MATPYVTIVRDVVSSTQDLAAAELGESGGPVLVVAHEQTAGRGRVGNPWWQAERAVAASLALPIGLLEVDQRFPLAIGLAVRKSIEARIGRRAGLKWPNDITLDGAKVGGILVEISEDSVVVGCGLNLFWPDPPEGAGALCDADPGEELGLQLAQDWVEAVLSDGFSWDGDSYRSACETLGSRIEWQPMGSGLATGIADDGGLIVETDGGLATLRSGEVRTIRPATDDA